MVSSSSQSTSARKCSTSAPSISSITSVFILSAVLLITPATALRSSVRVANYRLSSLYASTFMAPADLTPAIDKFVRLPTGPNIDPYFMTAAGPAPAGPEPFAMVSSELQPLSDYVREMVVSENPVLTMAASHFFEKVSVDELQVEISRPDSDVATFPKPSLTFTTFLLISVRGKDFARLLLPLWLGLSHQPRCHISEPERTNFN